MLPPPRHFTLMTRHDRAGALRRHSASRLPCAAFDRRHCEAGGIVGRWQEGPRRRLALPRYARRYDEALLLPPLHHASWQAEGHYSARARTQDVTSLLHAGDALRAVAGYARAMSLYNTQRACVHAFMITRLRTRGGAPLLAAEAVNTDHITITRSIDRRCCAPVSALTYAVFSRRPRKTWSARRACC